MRGRAFVGMAGWVYEPWRGTFYPAGLPQKRELEYASSQVSSIELNGSFYGLPKPSTWQAWYDATPDGFVFSVKAPRLITYLKKLRGVEGALAEFFGSGLLSLGPKLGAVLWQLPPTLAFDPALIDEFLGGLPTTMRHALEVRHPSFIDDRLTEIARRHSVAMVYGDTAGLYPVIDETTSDFRYARLHGDVALYPDGWYEPADLERWAARITGWLDDGLDAYVYFVNDTKVRSPIDAMSLMRMLA